ncbi:MAG: hypothetical protein ACM3WP_16570 [Acidobacteriota bacterium]
MAALSLPSTMTDSANVASATEGAAPNKPAKLFGLKRSPSSAKVETDTPPMMKRIRISFIMPRQNYPRTLQSLSLINGTLSPSPSNLEEACGKGVVYSTSLLPEYSDHRIIESCAHRYKSGMSSDTNPDKRDRFESDERSPERKGDLQAQLDELGDDPAQVGVDSAGQTVSSQGLSEVRDADEESVEELSDADQAIEAAAVEGVEDAADHPERPTHTHEEYGNPDDVPPRRRDDAA